MYYLFLNGEFCQVTSSTYHSQNVIGYEQKETIIFVKNCPISANIRGNIYYFVIVTKDNVPYVVETDMLNFEKKFSLFVKNEIWKMTYKELLSFLENVKLKEALIAATENYDELYRRYKQLDHNFEVLSDELLIKHKVVKFVPNQNTGVLSARILLENSDRTVLLCQDRICVAAKDGDIYRPLDYNKQIDLLDYINMNQ